RAQVARQRAQAVVPCEPARAAGLQPPRLKVDVVMDNKERIRLDLKEPGSSGDRAARLVHVGLRFHQREPELPEPHLRQRAGELGAPRAAMPARNLVEHHPAGVVPCALVLAPGIAEPRDEQVQRRGPAAPPEEPHLALGVAGLALGAGAGLFALGARLAFRSFLALRNLLALGQLAFLELLLALDFLGLGLDELR